MFSALAIGFGIMIFVLILNKGHLLFVNVSSLLIITMIAMGCGFGIAGFIISISMTLLKILGLIAIIIVLLTIFSRKGDYP